MLSLRFIKPGLLPTSVIKQFKTLLSRRTDVDYGDFETVDSADAEDSVRITEELIDQIDEIRRQLISSSVKGR